MNSNEKNEIKSLDVLQPTSVLHQCNVMTKASWLCKVFNAFSNSLNAKRITRDELVTSKRDMKKKRRKGNA